MVVLSIYILGGEALRGFAFTLLVGVLAGTYSSIYIASPLVLFFRKHHL
jgi:preprotein translocase subunit SecF